MAPLIRFKLVEIDSNISFTGKTKKKLKYPVRSLALIPVPKIPATRQSYGTIPEIFWQ
jgi:hypothetical protein